MPPAGCDSTRGRRPVTESAFSRRCIAHCSPAPEFLTVAAATSGKSPLEAPTVFILRGANSYLAANVIANHISRSADISKPTNVQFKSPIPRLAAPQQPQNQLNQNATLTG
jgi:hypothetical protein